MSKSVLVVGYTTRHVAASAYAAGFTVYAVDHFCDADLIEVTEDRMAFDELEELPFCFEEMFSKYHPDYVVTTSGAELLEFPNRLGTSPSVATRFMDKSATQDFFESLGVPVPKRLGAHQYPAMAKTLGGAGGWRNAIVHSDAELEEWKEFVEGDPFMLQEYIEGMPASCCCLVAGGKAVVLTTNQQILRGGDTCAFAFSGSITPCPHPMAGKMAQYAEKIAAATGCLGCIGIDFVLTDDEAYAIEINPRFQGTLETVESTLKTNVFQLHLNACNGILPETVPEAHGFTARKILVAPHDMTLKSDLLSLRDIITDIPYPGTFFEEGMVLFSVTGSGDTVEAAKEMLDNNIRLAIQNIEE
ncbi:MAG TPA: ATP-grasp domain-containing protein [Methanocorpusculum sp.]|nr:ATP-grasp domain-containing protein [Methanocorpusculum sp.]HJJ39988.1 ATP-grasp domain-containing protein [Methanocorpusculum sp.]HJJ49471.1 ATP-grasp domain-containing protein [Methanocorpusculum sp.]HJJ57023.1 ATP-grasp domain-containing protein [Methanocorpusculum sp.]